MKVCYFRKTNVVQIEVCATTLFKFYKDSCNKCVFRKTHDDNFLETRREYLGIVMFEMYLQDVFSKEKNPTRPWTSLQVKYVYLKKRYVILFTLIPQLAKSFYGAGTTKTSVGANITHRGYSYANSVSYSA